MTREQIVEVARAAHAAGLVVAAGGNVAARSGTGTLWVTPTGCSLGGVGVADLAEVTVDGYQVGGPYAPTTELPLHLSAFAARPDISWSLHLHPPTATLLDALDVPIRTITTDHAFSLREIARVPYLHPGGAEVAAAGAAALTGADVVLLRHHGCLVVADTPEVLVSRALNLEAAAVATYRARLLGDTGTVCPPGFLEHVRREEAAGSRYGVRHSTG